MEKQVFTSAGDVTDRFPWVVDHSDTHHQSLAGLHAKRSRDGFGSPFRASPEDTRGMWPQEGNLLQNWVDFSDVIPAPLSVFSLISTEEVLGTSGFALPGCS